MVVGAGAAGTLTAARVLDEVARRDVAATVTLLDSRPSTGQGVAFSTTDERHLLNVPAFKMSAYPEDGEHFLHWLDARGRSVEPYTFVPRSWYGEYLADVLDAACRRAARSTPMARAPHWRRRAPARYWRRRRSSRPHCG